MPMEYFDPDKIKTVDKHCTGCVYLSRVSGADCCDYIGLKDKCRPCPAGKGCTVKKLAPKKRSGIVII